MIGDRERAEDLVQEAFVRVYRHLHRFDPTKKFSTWIYTIASNLAKNELRNRSRSPLVFYQSLRRPGRGGSAARSSSRTPSTRPDDMYANRYLREMVDADGGHCSRRTTARCSCCGSWRGGAYEEIAQLTHCNLGTVKSRLNRARRAFAERIAPFLD